MKFSLQKTILSCLVLFFFANSLLGSTKLSVYVSAHQDDWQLFMGVNAYNDISGSSDLSRIVFIYVTAGDFSECLNISDKVTVPYYLAREQGAKNSVELAANSHKECFIWNNDTVTINQHLLIRCTYKFTTCYFLRLADGGMDGSRNISLKNFRSNRFTHNYSIDSLTHYKDWNDLSQTCENILAHELKNTNDVWLNLFDTSEIINPGDHSDHYESALLFLKNKPGAHIKIKLFEGYNSGKVARFANLDGNDIMKESGLFAAYNQAMVDNHYPSIWNNDYIGFCDNNYFRIVSGEQKTEIISRKIAIAIFILFILITTMTSYYLLKRK